VPERRIFAASRLYRQQETRQTVKRHAGPLARTVPRSWRLDVVERIQEGKAVPERVVVLPQFPVSADRPVRMAERAADSQITASMPCPSVVTAAGFDVRRLPRADPGRGRP
jgi:hypothetical protein